MEHACHPSIWTTRSLKIGLQPWLKSKYKAVGDPISKNQNQKKLGVLGTLLMPALRRQKQKDEKFVGASLFSTGSSRSAKATEGEC